MSTSPPQPPAPPAPPGGVGDRRHGRLPINLRVEYRSSGAFLVAYSINLSKGGIFLETNTPLAIGERVSLEFEVPGAGVLQVQGVVAWVRQASPDALPDGMGVQFDQLDEHHGERIDALVSSFVGLTVLVVAASPDRLALLGRYVRSIISCNIVEATRAELAEVALDEAPDLVIVDLDIKPEMGLGAVKKAKARPEAIPVVVLAAAADRRENGKRLGADEALATPPSFHDLQAAVVRMLSRPSAHVQTPAQNPPTET